MKNLILHSFFAILICTITSCSNEENANTAEQAETAYDLKEITKEYNNVHRNIPAEYFESNVDFGISEENLVLLVGKAGDYKTSFKIQLKNNSINELENLKTDDFKIAYLGRELVLSNGGETFYFIEVSS